MRVEELFAGMADRLPEGEPKDWSMAWKLRVLAAGFQAGDVVAPSWPQGDDIQKDLLDTANWIEEAARRLNELENA